MENSEATWKKATKCNKHIPWQISEYINNSNKIDIFTLNMFCLHGNHKKTMHKKWLKVLGQIVMHNPSAPVIFISQKAFLWPSFLLIKMPLLYTIARKNEVEELYTGHSFYIPLTHVLLPSYSTFVFPVKMEYEWNSTIFGLKVMVKIGLEKIFLPLFLWSDLFRVSLQILHFVVPSTIILIL